jgi:TolB-like protein
MVNSRNTQTVTPIPEAEIRAELERILASRGFATAGRISKLLRYVVEKTLAGETSQLKEYSVGVEVFERDDKYDPRLDSIVRVEAGRLRSKLDEYYNQNGAGSTVRIGLPRGGYSATFARRPSVSGPDPESESAADSVSGSGSGTGESGVHSVSGSGQETGVDWGARRDSTRRRATGWPMAIALFAAIAAMVVWLATRDRQVHPDLRPTAAVLPFQANMIGGDNDNYSAQITEAVTTELARLGTVSVTSFTSAMQFAGRRPPMSEVASALKSRYIVEASVDDEASEILIVARIVNSETDRKMWVSDYRGAREDVRGIAQRIAFDVSAAILEREATR